MPADEPNHREPKSSINPLEGFSAGGLAAIQ